MRWGIIGTGYAAQQFINGLRELDDVNIRAVASQSPHRASQFAAQYSIDAFESSYSDLIARQDIDIVYIGAIASLHHALCMECIESGMPVVCEKPFAMNADEAAEIAQASETYGVFCMEAMWSRFIPLHLRLRDLVASGEIGEVMSVSADFGLRQTPRSNPRLFRSDSGGAILDLGVYPTSLAVQYLGEPDHVHWDCVNGRYGPDALDSVNERAVGAFRYKSGALATVAADIVCELPTQATIVGTDGVIQIDTPMYRPDTARLTRSAIPAGAFESTRSGNLGLFNAKQKARRILSAVKRRCWPPYRTIHVGYRGNGYQYQASEAMKCLQDGLVESSIMPLDQSVAVLRTIDQASREGASGQADPQDFQTKTTERASAPPLKVVI
ncbi:Gfo/Idh/MocA family protein [Planctomycetes bacterium K23_9]|uniref:1,5-anhydro-D-fructose reductase n=1 Tax=Stieleria marina TaxID=1930275 RepID=A0A517NNV5_9BACT|nr:1,5-anhydro-D-fructose reductase [Planctomycetes bacterium K23_9]